MGTIENTTLRTSKQKEKVVLLRSKSTSDTTSQKSPISDTAHLIQNVSSDTSTSYWQLRSFLILADSVLINLGFLCAFLLRYGWPFPEMNFFPYKKSFIGLTALHIFCLLFLGTYRCNFRSSWDLFTRITKGQFFAAVLGLVSIYIFRITLGTFSTSIFLLSFLINTVLLFIFNREFLIKYKRITKKVVVVGNGDIDLEDVSIKKANIEKHIIHNLSELANYQDAHEVIICDQIHDDQNILIHLIQRLGMVVTFSPHYYLSLLPEKINHNSSIINPQTFIGRKTDTEEFLMRSLDVVGSITSMIILSPLIICISLLIKLTSKGPVIYKQQRIGKDGKLFTLFKFRTMVENAELLSGFAPATRNDPRITGAGAFLRKTRLDEIPQLVNVLLGQMSLVGPRPENLHRVTTHRVLQGIRLAVKPGITGLAQIRSFYDLHPKHKIKYDYLYVQRRSLLLNLYIIINTIPVIMLRKGQ